MGGESHKSICSYRKKHIRNCFVLRNILDIPYISEQYIEAGFLQDAEQWSPINLREFHWHNLCAAAIGIWCEQKWTRRVHGCCVRYGRKTHTCMIPSAMSIPATSGLTVQSSVPLKSLTFLLSSPWLYCYYYKRHKSCSSQLVTHNLWTGICLIHFHFPSLHIIQAKVWITVLLTLTFTIAFHRYIK